MKRVMLLYAAAGLLAAPAYGQSFFSFSASSDGVGFTMGDMFLPPPPPAPPVVDVRVPFLPGYGYEVMPSSSHMSRKARKKAARRYRKAVRRAAEAWNPLMMVYSVPAVVYYGDYDDDDFYDDCGRHHRKHHNKHHKKHGRHHKKHRHYHSDD